MTLLLADLARDSLLSFFQSEFPGQIAAVNAARPTKHALGAVATWAASPLVAMPETPAVGILVQTSGFRTTNWNALADERHVLHVYVQTANQDEELLEQDIIGWQAVLAQCMWLVLKGSVPFPNGVQFLFAGDGSEAFVFGPRQMAASLYYADVTMPVDVFFSEVP
jgi:hypothetical protein